MNQTPSIPPILTVVASPNGSGKSAVTAQLRLHDRMPVLDPDAIARETNPQNMSQVAISAGREVLESWRRFIAERVSFAIETTLAGVGPLVHIREAGDAGYLIHVHYVAIDTRELNVERVRCRVLQGGHGIPERDIRRRYERSLANAAQVLALAERAALLDNSFAPDDHGG